MKQPVYAPREEHAIRTTHSVIMRVRIQGAWRESPNMRDSDEPVLDAVARIQDHIRRAIRHTPGAAQVIVCLVGRTPEDREDFLVPLPLDYIPTRVREILS